MTSRSSAPGHCVTQGKVADNVLDAQQKATKKMPPALPLKPGRSHQPLANRDAEWCIIPGSHKQFPEAGIGEVKWQGSKEAVGKQSVRGSGDDLCKSSDTREDDLLLHAPVASTTRSSQQFDRSTTSQPHLATMSRQQLAAEHKKMQSWLAERKQLNHMLNTFADPKTFIERNPATHRTPLDNSVLVSLETQNHVTSLDHRRSRSSPKPKSKLELFAESLNEDVIEEEHLAAKLEAKLELGKQREVLKSMEAMNSMLRRHQYRIEATFNRLDTKGTGILSRGDIEKVFQGRAFLIELSLLKAFLDPLDKGRTGMIDYRMILPMDGRPWRDLPLAERWPDHLSQKSYAFLKEGSMATSRPVWGTSRRAAMASSAEQVSVASSKAYSRELSSSASSRSEQVDADRKAREEKQAARLKEHCATALKPPAMAKLREAYQDQVKHEYEKVLEWCRRNNVTLNESLLKLLLVPTEDAPCLECVRALQQPGTGAADLLAEEAIQAKIDAYMESIGLGPPPRQRKKPSKYFDTSTNYTNSRSVSSPATMRLPTGHTKVGPKVDCWMSLDEYKRLTSGMKTKFLMRRTRVGDTEDTKGMDAFWPGFMLDRLRLWMPVITNPASANKHNALLNGDSSTTKNALFECVHRQATRPAHAPPGNRHTARAVWPTGEHGHVQHGSVDKCFKSCYL